MNRVLPKDATRREQRNFGSSTQPWPSNPEDFNSNKAGRERLGHFICKLVSV